MGTIVDLDDAEWEQVADLFDAECRRGAPEVYPRSHGWGPSSPTGPTAASPSSPHGAASRST